RHGGPGRWRAVPGGAATGTAVASTCCSPMRRPPASGVAPTRPPPVSPRCTTSSPGRGPRGCRLVTCPPTPRAPPAGRWTAPSCATSSGVICSTSRRAMAWPSPFLVVAMPAETGFPRADAEDDFIRARRRQVLARLAHRLRREPDDVNLILPFDEVVAALGMRGEHYLGLQTINLDTVVGTGDSTRDFDRQFRPTSGRVRE